MLKSTLVYLLYKDEMLSVCLSVGTFWHVCTSTVSPRIDVRLARNEAPFLGEQAVHFKMAISFVVYGALIVRV